MHMNGERAGGGGSINSFNEKLRARQNRNGGGTYAVKKTVENDNEGSVFSKSKSAMKNRVIEKNPYEEEEEDDGAASL
jgi:hypothetical protein